MFYAGICNFLSAQDSNAVTDGLTMVEARYRCQLSNAGTLLNCINQLPDLMDGEPLNVGKMMLTYLVPYSVSLYSSIMTVIGTKS